MATAGHFLKDRTEAERTVHTIAPDATVLDAAKRMNDRHIGSLVVVGDDGCAVGIFTERDLLKRVVAERLDPAETRVRDVMTAELIVCTTDTPLDEIRHTFRERRVRHLPVVDGEGHVVGMISIGDLNVSDVKHMTETIAYLEQYMTQL